MGQAPIVCASLQGALHLTGVSMSVLQQGREFYGRQRPGAHLCLCTLAGACPGLASVSGFLLGPQFSSFLPHNHLAAEPSLSGLKSQHCKHVKISASTRFSLALPACTFLVGGRESVVGAGRAAPLAEPFEKQARKRGLTGNTKERETGGLDHSCQSWAAKGSHLAGERRGLCFCFALLG